MSSGTTRLFFALWPGVDVRERLAAWQAAHLSGDWRGQHRDDLHMTLHFLGPVEQSRIAALTELGERCRTGPFELVLDHIGHWPRPQVLWAGPSAAPDRLLLLHETLGAGLERLGFEREVRAYRPHITLARKVRGLPPPLDLPSLTWQVDCLTLVESGGPPAGRDGPCYRCLASWPLAVGRNSH